LKKSLGVNQFITQFRSREWVFPIRYDWGTLDVLNKFLILPENVSKYPLIWLITGKDTEDYISKTVTRKARFVIATRSNDVDQFNETQYQTDFKIFLFPFTVT
jgi:hypothetical protein